MHRCVCYIVVALATLLSLVSATRHSIKLEDGGRLGGFNFFPSNGNRFRVDITCSTSDKSLCDNAKTAMEDVTERVSKVLNITKTINVMIEVSNFSESPQRNIRGVTLPFFVRGQRAVNGPVESIPQALAKQAHFESFYTNFKMFEYDFIIKVNASSKWYVQGEKDEVIGDNQVDLTVFLSREIVYGLGWYSSYAPCSSFGFYDTGSSHNCILRRTYTTGPNEDTFVGFMPPTSFDMLLGVYEGHRIRAIDLNLERKFSRYITSTDSFDDVQLISNALENIPNAASHILSIAHDELVSYALDITHLDSITIFKPRTPTLMSMNLNGVPLSRFSNYVSAERGIDIQANIGEDTLRPSVKVDKINTLDLKLPAWDDMTYSIICQMGYNNNELTFRGPFVPDGSDGFEYLV